MNLNKNKQPMDLKYRIRHLSEMVGNKNVMEYISEQVSSGKYPQVQIITGPSGCGKTTLAYILAKSLLCKSTEGKGICGTCSSCIGIEETLYTNGEGSPGLRALTYDMGLNTGTEYLQEIASSMSSTHSSGNKVLIVEELQRQSKSDQESLLRSLENIPKGVYVIITTTALYKIEKAVQTRADTINLSYPSEVELIEYFMGIVAKEDIRITKSDLSTLIRHDGNNPRMILKHLESIKNSGKAAIDYIITLQMESNEKYINYFQAITEGIESILIFINDIPEPTEFVYGLSFFILDAFKLRMMSISGNAKYRQKVIDTTKNFKDMELRNVLKYLSSIRVRDNSHAEVILFSVATDLNELMFYTMEQPDRIENENVVEGEVQAPKSIELSLIQKSSSIKLDDL